MKTLDIINTIPTFYFVLSAYVLAAVIVVAYKVYNSRESKEMRNSK
jgi:hypothetical protein